MKVYYKKPILKEDKTVVVEQVYELGEETLPNGIHRSEAKLITETYPSVKLLLETIAIASKNFEDVSLQRDTPTGQLAGEKRALVELQVMLSDLLGD